MSDDVKNFWLERSENIKKLGEDDECIKLAIDFLVKTSIHKYSYNFDWLGRPAIQLPNDAWAMQELIWKIKPDLIIETGIAHGGSLIFSASMLSLLDMCEAIEFGTVLDPKSSKPIVRFTY